MKYLLFWIWSQIWNKKTFTFTNLFRTTQKSIITECFNPVLISTPVHQEDAYTLAGKKFLLTRKKIKIRKQWIRIRPRSHLLYST